MKLISKDEYLKQLKINPQRVKRTKNCYYLLDKNKWVDRKKKEGEKNERLDNTRRQL